MPSIFHNNSHKEEVDYGTTIAWSIPFHKLDMIPAMDRRAKQKKCQSRSHYLRQLVDEDIAAGKNDRSINVLQYT